MRYSPACGACGVMRYVLSHLSYRQAGHWMSEIEALLSAWRNAPLATRRPLCLKPHASSARLSGSPALLVADLASALAPQRREEESMSDDEEEVHHPPPAAAVRAPPHSAAPHTHAAPCPPRVHLGMRCSRSRAAQHSPEFIPRAHAHTRARDNAHAPAANTPSLLSAPCAIN
jgi:hypothetical protein